MAVDRYTKAVLTVIAMCLVWLSLGGPRLLTTVQAQSRGGVVLEGWYDDTGVMRRFPTPFPQKPSPLSPTPSPRELSAGLPMKAL
jgi:uncharacterized protein YodC (DUF2158 family)